LSWCEIALESNSAIQLTPPSVVKLTTCSGDIWVGSLDASLGSSVTDTDFPFQGCLRRSISTVVPSGYMFPGRRGTFLVLSDCRGPSSVVAPPGAVLGPASLGGGPNVPHPLPLPNAHPCDTPGPLEGVPRGGGLGGKGGGIVPVGPVGGGGGTGGTGRVSPGTFGGK